jgi:hypothetical protein
VTLTVKLPASITTLGDTKKLRIIDQDLGGLTIVQRGTTQAVGTVKVGEVIALAAIGQTLTSPQVTVDVTNNTIFTVSNRQYAFPWAEAGQVSFLNGHLLGRNAGVSTLLGVTGTYSTSASTVSGAFALTVTP